MIRYSRNLLSTADDLTIQEAKTLAEEAYIYGFGIAENYKAIFGMSVYEKSPQYSGFNNYLHARKLFDPDYKVVVSANNDTLYSTTWADLRTEPLVISVPPTGERYFSIQLVDMFTDNFAYIGTRKTGRDGGVFVLVGPTYKGSLPADKFDRVIVSRSHFVALATRTAVNGTEDISNVAAVQDKLKLQPLSAFLGTTPPKPAPEIDFPPYSAKMLYAKPKLLSYLNQFLEWQYPTLEEADLMARLSRINVGPGLKFELADFQPEIQEAIKAGISAGHAKIEERGNSLGKRIEGWEYTPPMGNYGTDYLFRSAVAWKFIYTHNPEEALYPIAETDDKGNPLTGSKKYTLHFPAGKLPPVNSFWSITMYHSDTRLMVHNPLKRYSIGDRTKGLKLNDDGSLTLHIQHEDPGAEMQSNWLPAPEGNFYVICRMYIPKEAALTGEYRLPPLAEDCLPDVQAIRDAYVYLMGRALVIRQEQTDLRQEGVDYNFIKYNPVGSADFVNPNLDVAYLEAWIGVDEKTPALLTVPEVIGRYYTAQILDEWGEVITNINERNYPSQPHGKFAFVAPGSTAEVPDGATRVELHSQKAKMLARVELKNDNEGAVALQRQFTLKALGKPAVPPIAPMAHFNNKELLGVEIFDNIEEVLSSAQDVSPVAGELKCKVRVLAEVAADPSRRDALDTLIQTEVVPYFLKFSVTKSGKFKNNWLGTLGTGSYGSNYWIRSSANLVGIWANTNDEVIYFVGTLDSEGKPLNGDNTYIIDFPASDRPDKAVDGYWSVILVDVPDYRVVANPLNRYNFNSGSPLVTGKDGSLKILVSPKPGLDIPESNWLPAIAGKGFSLTFRAYVPKDIVKTGEWFPPAIKRVN
ncbi:MAG: DUF1214 domain-containing protein [Desulfobacterales bacterium]